MTVEVVAPVEFQSAVIGGLNARRGTIIDSEVRKDEFTALAEVAPNDMFGYSSQLFDNASTCLPWQRQLEAAVFMGCEVNHLEGRLVEHLRRLGWCQRFSTASKVRFKKNFLPDLHQ